MRLSLGNQTLALFASPFWGIYRLGRLSEHVILRLLNLGVVNIYLDFIWVLFRRFLISVMGGSESSRMTSSGGIGLLVEVMANREIRSKGRAFPASTQRQSDRGFRLKRAGHAAFGKDSRLAAAEVLSPPSRPMRTSSIH